jgi:hypothetical protein
MRSRRSSILSSTSWEIDSKLQQAVARPIEFYLSKATCCAKSRGLNVMVNSSYNWPALRRCLARQIALAQPQAMPRSITGHTNRGPLVTPKAATSIQSMTFAA